MRALGFARTPTAVVGIVLFAVVLGIALFGPLLSPHSPDQVVGLPFRRPEPGTPLGTDFLGRDALSRVLWGGLSVFSLGVLTTLLAYLGGLSVGMLAGHTRGFLDAALMRGVDVLLAFPGLILLLLVINGLGSSDLALVFVVAILQVPSIARIIRTATLEQSLKGFVEAAIARGESTFAILRREILPNIVGPISADAGSRLTFSILIIAGVNFLGFGLEPPSADWGLMVAENRQGISLNPYVILVPATLIGLLTISLNLIADAIARSQGRST